MNTGWRKRGGGVSVRPHISCSELVVGVLTVIWKVFTLREPIGGPKFTSFSKHSLPYSFQHFCTVITFEFLSCFTKKVPLFRNIFIVSVRFQTTVSFSAFHGLSALFEEFMRLVNPRFHQNSVSYASDSIAHVDLNGHAV